MRVFYLVTLLHGRTKEQHEEDHKKNLPREESKPRV